jgi:hypothetical protein
MNGQHQGAFLPNCALPSPALFPPSPPPSPPLQDKDLSPLSLMLKAISPGASQAHPFLFQALALLPLVYMSACSYYALFKLNLLNYNKLVPGATTGVALMQVGGRRQGAG